MQVVGDSMVIQTTQCPPYDWTSQTTPNTAYKVWYASPSFFPASFFVIFPSVAVRQTCSLLYLLCRHSLTKSYPWPPIMNTYANRRLVGVYTDLAKTTANAQPSGTVGITTTGVAVYGN